MKYRLEGMTQQYAKHLRRWISFCFQNWIQPVTADVTNGAKMLN